MSVEHTRICTFNVYNLVREGTAYYSESPYSPEEFQQKTQWIGNQLDRMAVDMVGFQEVFHEDALVAALSHSERFQGIDPIVLGTNDAEVPAATPVVAFASRFPTTSAESLAGFPDDAVIQLPGAGGGQVTVPVSDFSRPVLKVGVQITGGFALTVFVIHLKSKRPTYLDGESGQNPLHRTLGSARALVRRAAEAAAVRSLLIAEMQNTTTPVIVLGDVNDSTLAVTTQMVAGEKPYHRMNRTQKEPYWDVLLYSAQEIQSRRSTRDTYFTYIYNGFYEALDQILVSEELYALNPDRVGEVDYVQIFNDHIIDESQSWEEVPRTVSDHGQVVARIRYEVA